MRQGGEAYFALDVTEPGEPAWRQATGIDDYACYLWEFPRENDGAAYQRLGRPELG